MPDQEVRLEILRILHDFYNENPYGFIEKQNVIERFSSDVDENVLDRNIKYLDDKGFIKLHKLIGGNFLAQITVDGIDFLESGD